MNRVEQAPNETGDLETLLTAFFRKEKPSPWPAAPATPTRSTAPRPHPAARWSRGWRSRLGLAASIGLLVLGATLLPGKFTGALRTGKFVLPREGEADRLTKPDQKDKSKKSSWHLEQGKEGTGIRINEVAPDR
jgi:hypothetical protein